MPSRPGPRLAAEADGAGTTAPAAPFPEPWRATLAERNREADARAAADYRRRLATAPPWWADREFVNGVALEMLPAVCHDLGLTLVLGAWRPGDIAWWPPTEPGWVVAVADAGDRRTVFIDRASGYWILGAFERRGTDLIGLAAFRWGASATKAAWRLARLCGLRRPHA